MPAASASGARTPAHLPLLRHEVDHVLVAARRRGPPRTRRRPRERATPAAVASSALRDPGAAGASPGRARSVLLDPRRVDGQALDPRHRRPRARAPPRRPAARVSPRTLRRPRARSPRPGRRARSPPPRGSRPRARATAAATATARAEPARRARRPSGTRDCVTTRTPASTPRARRHAGHEAERVHRAGELRRRAPPAPCCSVSFDSTASRSTPVSTRHHARRSIATPRRAVAPVPPRRRAS